MLKRDWLSSLRLAFAPGMKASAETLVVNDFGARGDGAAAIQRALDKGVGKRTTITFQPGGGRLKTEDNVGLKGLDGVQYR